LTPPPSASDVEADVSPRGARRRGGERPAAEEALAPPPSGPGAAAVAAAPEDPALRPRSLDEFVGQARARAILSQSAAGARARGEAVDHVLLLGPPGHGKTTLARLVAETAGTSFLPMVGPAVARAADLVSVLVQVEPRAVLFIDEIHRLPVAIAEMLYTAMEDRRIDIVVGEPGQGRAVSIPLPPFTLVGATTNPGGLPGPLRQRFGIHVRIEPYRDDELARIAGTSAARVGLALAPGLDAEIARRSRGTPRVAVQLVRRLLDAAAAAGAAAADRATAEATFSLLGIGPDGLHESDRAYLLALSDRFRGGPVGLKTIAAALGEDERTVEEEIEPWLLRRGLVERTPRGRCLPGRGAARGGIPAAGQADPVLL